MATDDRSLPAFYRDAAVATLVYALVLAPVAGDLGPEFLSLPGYLLYFPLFVLYIVAGGETEGPHGPSMLLFAAYVIALGLLTAAIAGMVRRRVDTSGLATWRFPVAGILAIAGTIASLVGLLGLVGLFYVGFVGPPVVLIAGVVLLGAGIALAATAG